MILSFKTYRNPNNRKTTNEDVMKSALNIAVINLTRKKENIFFLIYVTACISHNKAGYIYISVFYNNK